MLPCKCNQVLLSSLRALRHEFLYVVNCGDYLIACHHGHKILFYLL